MKKSIIILFALTIILTSCQEVIDIDLNSSATQVVIEGNINSNTNEAIVKISNSINFDETNNFPKKENYLVKITDDNKFEYILDEIEPGIYKKEINQISAGTEFQMLVEGNQQQFSSKSTLQTFVQFDSLIVIKNITNKTGPGSGKKGYNYEIKVAYKDPAGIKNYYRFVLTLNGVVSENNYVYDDRLTDGKNIETPLLGNNNKFEPGDTLKIEMQNIDKNIYEYFKGFGTSFGKFQPSSTPANPLNNIVGSKLGYFNVHTSQFKSFILP